MKLEWAVIVVELIAVVLLGHNLGRLEEELDAQWQLLLSTRREMRAPELSDGTHWRDQDGRFSSQTNRSLWHDNGDAAMTFNSAAIRCLHGDAGQPPTADIGEGPFVQPWSQEAGFLENGIRGSLTAGAGLETDIWLSRTPGEPQP